MKNLNIWIFLILSGLIIGSWSFFSFATFFVIIAGFLVLAPLPNYFDGESKKKIMIFLFTAFSIRILFAVLYYYLSFKDGFGMDFFGDARGYSHSGLYIAYVLKKISFLNFPYFDNSWTNSLEDSFYYMVKKYNGSLPPLTDYRTGFFVYLIGIFYTLLGYSPLAFKFLNGFFGVMIAVVTYFLAKRLFGKKEAYLSFIITLFYPSLLFWSITGLKDTMLTLSIVLIMLFFLKLREKLSLTTFFLLICFIIIFNLIFVGKFVAIFLVILCVSFLMLKQFKLKFKIIAIFSVLLGLVLFLNALGKLDVVKTVSSLHNFENTISSQVGCINTGGSTYKIYPEKCYLMNDYNINFFELITSYFKGLAHVLFAPFPWRLQTKAQIFMMPEVLLAYIGFPYLLIGIFRIRKEGWKNFIELLIFSFFYISVLSLVEGNIGTLYRHKSILIPFAAIFVSAGIVYFQKNKKLNLNER